jgi:hypothetical protein
MRKERRRGADVDVDPTCIGDNRIIILVIIE